MGPPAAVRCIQCKADNRAGRLFCRNCGAALPAACPRCGFANEADDRYCGGCGTALAAPGPRHGAAAVGTPPEPAAEGERRQLTVMFCDLADSVALSERLDPEDLRTVIRAFHACCAMVIANFDGHIAKYMGDGLLAYFGYPEAHEDDAERAVRAGLGIVEAVKKLRFPGGLQLHVRVGISTGLVVVGDVIGEGAAREEAVSGDIPNRAARMQAIAEPDTVVIGNVVRRLIGGLFECADLGKQLLKGFSEPMRLWRVVGESSIESRFEAIRAGLTPLVGRGAEMQLLLNAWARARASSGALVLVTGEAGLGKSRLVEELRQVLAAESMMAIGYQCSPHHKDSALYPVVAQLERAAGFERSDEPARRAQKLEALLRRWSAQPARLMPLLAGLLQLPVSEPAAGDAEWQRESTLAALVSLIEELARRQPLLVIFEDAHWMDATTLRLVGLLVPRIRPLPVLVVVTHRPDFEPPWPAAGHVESLSLRRFAARDCAAIIANLTDGKALPPGLLRRVVGRSDGVPLYVEELTKAVLASGALAEEDGRLRLTGPLPVAVPDTLQDSLLARLGRDRAAKEVAQVASAIGRQFSHELLLAVSPLSRAETEGALQRLIRSELVFRRGTPPRATYRFKHALLQDAAYATLLRRRRQRLHARIAEVLEQRFADVVDGEPEVLAHHWTGAGAGLRAARYWLRAGERAIGSSAMAEAQAHLRKAADLLAGLPEEAERLELELEVQCGLGTALQALSGPSAEETAAAWRRARALCRQTGRRDRLLHALYGLGVYHFVRAEFVQSRAASEELLQTAEAADDAHGRAMAHRCLGADLFMIGDFAQARGNLERALSLLEAEEAGPGQTATGYAYDSAVVCLGYLSWDTFILGYPDTAQALCRRLLGRARALKHPHTLAYAFDAACTLFQLFGIRRHVERQAARLLALAEKQDFAFWRAQALLYQAWAASGGPQAEGAVKALRDGLHAHWATGAQVFTPFHQGLLAEGCCRIGGVEDGLALVGQALAQSERTGERWFAAELHRIRARLNACCADRAEAEADLAVALDIARAQGARLWELRAATDLARLWLASGRADEAEALLRPLRDGFREGLRTAELVEAAALLAGRGADPGGCAAQSCRPASPGIAPQPPDAAGDLPA
ncbi:MAG: AAA family ATPase [Rhodospirillaceae bacterium]|nr:AAA family ATPase [Rhodospirillaceae bacterium]